VNEEHQRQLTGKAAARAGVTVRELWLHYVSIGGSADEIDIEAYLHGLIRLPGLDRDVIAHALNEILEERGLDLRAPYSDGTGTGSNSGDPDLTGRESALAALGAVGAFLLSPREAELQRLASLQRTGLLDTPPEERFDRITRKAREVFGVGSAAIAFLAADRQFLKSVAGPLPPGIPRDMTFCDHTIRSPEPLVVNDALADDRFKTSTIVVAGPRIRFYAGRPLRGPGGWHIGTFCLLDRQPRTLSPEQEEAFRTMAESAQQEIRAPA
jgi:hypothetical protein